MSSGTVAAEALIDSSPEFIWQIMTNLPDIKRWYFDLEEFRAEPGFRFTFYGGTEQRQYLHLCEITEVIPAQKLAYTWKYDGLPGETVVTFSVESADDKTIVKVSHAGIESFGTDNPDLQPENFAAGWDYILNESLKNYAENNYIEISIDINASVSSVWKVFTDRDLSKVWLNEFMENSYIECDWHAGSIMYWKDSDGAIKARGLIVESQIESVIRIAVFDNPDPASEDAPGKYSEFYEFTKTEGGTKLSTFSGPVPRKNHAEYLSVWERSFDRIKGKSEELSNLS